MTSPNDAATTMYGVTAELVNAIPELRDKLNQAVAGGWSQDKLNAAISETQWYKTNGQNLRNALMQMATDPATFNANVANTRALIQQTAAQMGRNVQLDGNGSMVWRYLTEGWSAENLKAQIGAQGGLQSEGFSDSLAGDAGQLQNHLKQTARAYGVPFTDQFINDSISRIQAGQDTTDGFDSLMRARAVAAYPQFAAQIDAGQTLSQIADPYMATYAKTLEVPQTQVTLDDPLIKKALAQTDPKTGAVTSQPLWQFEQTVKKDPRYGMTDQAKTDAYSMLNKIGQDWGMTGGGKA